MLLDGKPLDITPPKDALDAGIVYLTEDRKGQGLFLDMSVRENINVGVIDRDAAQAAACSTSRPAKRRAEDAFQALRIRAAQPAGQRSAASRAATSRRCCCRAGSRPAPRC